MSELSDERLIELLREALSQGETDEFDAAHSDSALRQRPDEDA